MKIIINTKPVSEEWKFNAIQRKNIFVHLWNYLSYRKVWLNSTVFHQTWIFKENDTCVLWFTTPTRREYKRQVQLVIFILRKVTFNIQPKLQPLTMSYHCINYYGGLGYGLGGFGGLGYYGLGGYGGYGCGYFDPTFYRRYWSSGFFWIFFFLLLTHYF